MELGLPKKILYRIENLNSTETRTFITEILPQQVAHFNRHYKVHDHDSGDCEIGKLENVYELKNVYELISKDLDRLTLTLMVKVKSFVYGNFNGGIIRRLNIDDFESKWQLIKQPLSPHRWDPKLISLRDKLYVFGGIPTNLIVKVNYDLEPFGEVYDPEFDRWSTLVAPPQGPLLNQCFESLLVASLGESEGKIMVYSPIDEVSVLYIYDVDTEVWETRPCSVLNSILIANRTISGSEVINKYDNMLYWLDKRTTFIYAFDWRKQLYSGPIIGLQCEHGFNSMISETNFVSLHHLSLDLFYLFWHTSNWEEKSDVKTSLHLTFLRVVKHISLCALDAFVVGCLDTTVSGSYLCYDAVNV